MSYAKNWCGTVNNYTEEDKQNLEKAWTDKHLSYLIYAEEVGASGTPHLQVYLSLVKRERLSWLKNQINNTAHWEAMRGSPKQASDYCKKPSTDPSKIHEFGQLPETPSSKGGESTASKWHEIHGLAKQADTTTFLELYPRESFLHLRNFQSLVEAYRPKPMALAEMRHWWYIGNPGTGKSRTARHLFPDAYIKPTSTKWWPSYAGEREVIIDDLGKDHAYVLEWLKNWADHYPFVAENKGGHTGMIRPHSIIVTSNYHWNELTTDIQLRQAISRRFTIKRFGSGLGETSFEREIATSLSSTGRSDGERSQEVEPLLHSLAPSVTSGSQDATAFNAEQFVWPPVMTEANKDSFRFVLGEHVSEEEENEDFGDDCSCFGENMI